ncbi:MAG: hypothetical protein JWO76_1307 [Nocardioides sp.]|nr:hypothetical protein [Nocardioides sp.]
MTTPHGARTRLVLTSLLVTSTLVLAACGGSGDPKADPSPSSSTSATTSSEPSESESASVAPAAGKLVETKFFTAHVPEGWDLVVVSKGFVITSHDPDSESAIGFAIVDTFGKDRSLEDLARQAVRNGAWPSKDPSIVAETELGGEPAYHLTSSGDGVFIDVRGLLRSGNAIAVRFDNYRSEAALRATVDSVLATWQWK